LCKIQKKLDNGARRNNKNQLRKGKRNANKSKVVATEQESVETKTEDTNYLIYWDKYDCKRVWFDVVVVFVIWLNCDCVQSELSLTIRLMS
jgi:hypothetical protein